jgi:hypothetical protein
MSREIHIESTIGGRKSKYTFSINDYGVINSVYYSDIQVIDGICSGFADFIDDRYVPNTVMKALTIQLKGEIND